MSAWWNKHFAALYQVINSSVDLYKYESAIISRWFAPQPHCDCALFLTKATGMLRYKLPETEVYSSDRRGVE